MVKNILIASFLALTQASVGASYLGSKLLHGVAKISPFAAQVAQRNPRQAIIAATAAAGVLAAHTAQSPQIRAGASLTAAVTAGAVLGYAQKTMSEYVFDQIMSWLHTNVSNQVPAQSTSDGMKAVKTVVAAALGLAIKYGVVYPLYRSFNTTIDIKGKPTTSSPQHTAFDVSNNIAGTVTPLKLAFEALQKLYANRAGLWEQAVAKVS